MKSPHIFEPGKSKYLVITSDYLIPFLLSIGVIFLFYLSFLSPVFTVKNITCSLDYLPCTDQSIVAEIDKLKTENIFRLTPHILTHKLTSGDFTIREVSIKKTLPDQLTVSLQSVYPVIAIQVEGDTTWAVLDPKFRLIAIRDLYPNVPTLIIPGPLTLAVGKPITDHLLENSLNLTLRLGAGLGSIKTITLVDDNTIKIMLSSGVVAIFSPKSDETDQLKLLQAVLSDDIITQGVRTIDVRFIQPVLR